MKTRLHSYSKNCDWAEDLGARYGRNGERTHTDKGRYWPWVAHLTKLRMMQQGYIDSLYTSHLTQLPRWRLSWKWCDFSKVPIGTLDFFLNNYFIWEREEERDSGRDRGGGRQHLKQTPCWVWSPTWGSIPGPWDHDLSRNQESNTWPTVALRCWAPEIDLEGAES